MLTGMAEQNIFLLRTAVQDVEDPAETATLALTDDEGSYMLRVDGGCFGDDVEALGGVFLDVFFAAGVDEVEF